MLRANNHDQGNGAPPHTATPVRVCAGARREHLRSALIHQRTPGERKGGRQRLPLPGARLPRDPQLTGELRPCGSPASVSCATPAPRPMPLLPRLDFLSLMGRNQCPPRPSPPACIPITGLCSATPVFISAPPREVTKWLLPLCTLLCFLKPRPPPALAQPLQCIADPSALPHVRIILVSWVGLAFEK